MLNFAPDLSVINPDHRIYKPRRPLPGDGIQHTGLVHSHKDWVDRVHSPVIWRKNVLVTIHALV